MRDSETFSFGGIGCGSGVAGGGRGVSENFWGKKNHFQIYVSELHCTSFNWVMFPMGQPELTINTPNCKRILKIK
jgi:hypothetical protein